jgi:HEAT repeat protein
MAARRHDAGAAETIWNLRGKAGGMFDPVFDALIKLGAPSLPYLARALAECGGRELAKGRLDDPKATIELEEAGLAASAIFQIVNDDPKANAPQLATSLIDALDCGDASVRQLSARAVGLLDHIDPPEVETLRKRVLKDRRPDVRSFSASILAAHACGDSATIKVLERALSDRSDVVRLGAANALVRLKQPKRALPALKSLASSHNPEIASLAKSVLQSPPAPR